MAAEHERRDVFDRDVQRLGEKASHACRVEHAGHAHYAVFRKSRAAKRDLRHRVERIRNDDDKSVWRIFRDLIGDRADDVGIGLEQVVAAHAGLSRQAGGDDDDIGIRRLLVRIRTDELYVKTVDRSRLCEVERFALRRSLDDIHQNDVRKLFARDPMSGRRTDISRSDDRNLISSSSHYYTFLFRIVLCSKTDILSRGPGRMRSKSRKSPARSPLHSGLFRMAERFLANDQTLISYFQ